MHAWRLIVTTLAVALGLLCFQTFSQTQAGPANSLAERYAYERFEKWITAQPSDFKTDAEVKEKFKAYLRTQGSTEAESEQQTKPAFEYDERLEVTVGTILTAEKPRFNTNPNAFLIEMTKTRKPGAALDVGMGQGRNAIWLAQNGWMVTGFDPADKAVALANKTAQSLGVHLNTEITTNEKFDFGENRWDLILLSYAFGRELREKIEKALRPHGILVIEAFHRDAAKEGSIGGAVVFDTGELIGLFPDLRVVRYEEPVTIADFGKTQGRLVRYCGEKVD